jgi:hypothetical protein
VSPPAAINVATNGFFLGLGAFNDENDTVLRYQGIQVRSLTTPAVPQPRRPDNAGIITPVEIRR